MHKRAGTFLRLAGRFRSTLLTQKKVSPDFERRGPELTPESAFVLSTGGGSVEQARGLARAGGGPLGAGSGDRSDLTTATLREMRHTRCNMRHYERCDIRDAAQRVVLERYPIAENPEVRASARESHEGYPA